MILNSRLFGPLPYEDGDTLSFPRGVPGFQSHTTYLLHEDVGTRPLKWLLSLDEDGPEIPLLDPRFVDPAWAVGMLSNADVAATALGAESPDALDLYAVVSLSDGTEGVYMNLRHPLLVCHSTRLGMQYQNRDERLLPARQPISGELALSVESHGTRTRFIEVSADQSITVGSKAEIQATALADGTVSLVVACWHQTAIDRRTAVTAAKANQQANAQAITARAGAHIAALGSHMSGVVSVDLTLVDEEVDEQNEQLALFPLRIRAQISA